MDHTDESFTDANPEAKTGSASQAQAENTNGNNNIIKVSTNPDELYYDMSGQKYLVIFNHEIYKKTRYFKKVPPARKGTQEDVKRLKKVFGDALGFKVISFNDLEHDEILQKASEISSYNHDTTSCICIVIMTHGDKEGEVFAADRPYQLQDVFRYFQGGHASLAVKPKLFFIQACRGDAFDSGRVIQTDGDDSAYHIPSHIDNLVLYSTVEGYVAFKDIRGSWMIQELCNVLEEHYKEKNMLEMITILNNRIAYERVSYSPSRPYSHNKKQTPETRYTLTKLLHFK